MSEPILPRAFRRPASAVLQVLAVVLGLLLLSGEALAQSREFACSQAGNLMVIVEDAETISASLGNGKPRRLRNTADAPFDFTAAQVTLHITRNQTGVRIEQPGAEDIVCIYLAVNAPADRPFVAQPDEFVPGEQARSWGGVVRSGPGMDFDKVASLKEGEPIVLVDKTDAFMNGYPWFRISFGNGQTGFQWGGIICPVGHLLAGTFEQCN